MILIYLWIYTLLLVILWWFFMVAKVHAYNFINFSSNIQKYTKLLLIIMIILSLLWYISIIFWSFEEDYLEYNESDFNFNEVNY